MINPDWRVVCNTIRAKYKPLAQVAVEVGSDWRHLNRLARGEVGQPKYIVGVKLLAIFDTLKGKENEH